MTLSIEQLETLILLNLDKLPTFTTDRMSKTGVKWCKQVTRERIKRLRADLKEAKAIRRAA